MPYYTYRCVRENCEGSVAETRRSSIEDRDRQQCPYCGSVAERQGLEETQAPLADSTHQTKAILGDGTKIAGSFGQSARRRGRSGLL